MRARINMRVLVAAWVGLAAGLLLAGCNSGGSSALAPASTDSRLTVISAAPFTTTTAPATTTSAGATMTAAGPAATNAGPTVTSARLTTTTTPPVILPGGLVIQPYYQVVEAKGVVHTFTVPAGAVVQTFDQLNELNAVTTMLTVSSANSWGAQGWYQVLVPHRPNGSKAWVSSKEVSAGLVTTAVVVELGAHRLTLYDEGREKATFPVGVGSATNPTPTGDFFVTGVLRGDPSSAYGSYAIGTSAFSDTLTDWPGGGVVGIHGTNDPGSVGRSVSHGCVRLRNDDITQLALAVSLGTPIFILP